MNISARIVIIFLALFILPSSVLAQPYRILITNDDGIDNPGLIALAENLSGKYQVIVSAPARNMSGNSHATNLFKGPMKIDEIPHNGRYMGYGVHGTPADAARFGIIQMRNKATPVDLVISGINPGANISSLSHLSGTVGAAMEAQFYDIPAIALNLDRKAIQSEGYVPALTLVNKIIEQIRKNGLPRGIILNVNIPKQSKGLKIIPMGPSMLEVKSYSNTEAGYKPELFFPRPKPGETDNDTNAYLNGYTTITPLKIDWTAREILPALKEWDLE